MLPSTSPLLSPCRRAFSLVELLVVVGIIVAMMALIGPAMNALKSANDLTTAAFDISGVLDQARAYAITNRTYVFVGISEVDSDKEASAARQVETTAPAIGGRIAVAAVASKDGTRGYDVKSASLSTPAWVDPNPNLIGITKLRVYENLHLAPDYSTLGTTGGMTRQSPPNTTFMLGNNSGSAHPGRCVTVFEWPLGKKIGDGQYTFTRVINFDPDGVARIQYASSNTFSYAPMEIGLQQTRGKALAPAPTPATASGNVAAVQVDGLTGVSRVFRP